MKRGKLRVRGRYTEQGYMKIRGHRHLQFLKDHVAQIEMPFGP